MWFIIGRLWAYANAYVGVVIGDGDDDKGLDDISDFIQSSSARVCDIEVAR